MNQNSRSIDYYFSKFEPRTAVPKFSILVLKFTLTLSIWTQMARTRRQLFQLTPEELRDIGITKEQALKEARRPFYDY